VPQIARRLSKTWLAHPLVHVLARRAPDRGLCILPGLAVGVGIGLSGNGAERVRIECAVGRRGAGAESLGVEVGRGVVADFYAHAVLWELAGGVEERRR